MLLSFNPPMLSYLFKAESFSRAWLNHSSQQLFKLRGDLLRLFIAISHHQFVKLVGIAILERQISRQHRIKSDSECPYFSFLRIIAFTTHHLRSSVARRATTRFQLLSFLAQIPQPKVDECYLAISNYDVFWFDVSVNYSFLLQMNHSI